MSVIETLEDFSTVNVDVYDDLIYNKYIDKWNEICRTKIRESIAEYEADVENKIILEYHYLMKNLIALMFFIYMLFMRLRA